jgi:hypothetical protein
MKRLIFGIAIGAGIGGIIGYFGSCTTGVCPLTSNPYVGALFGGALGALFSIGRR